ncbi:MAG: S8 family serine peptidase [Candidatus Cloacimonetes bacterium]|nr:S8 family serine peptidase [Candidatus Cloacimonadota bacterium]
MTIKLKLFILSMLTIFLTISFLVSNDLDDFYPGILTVCFSADMIGNSRGDFIITHENGIVQTPFDWFNELAEEFQIINLTQKYRVNNSEWNLNGQHPSNIYRIEVGDHSRTNRLLEILSTRNNDVLFVEPEAINRFFYDKPVNNSSNFSTLSEWKNYLSSLEGTRYIPDDPLINQQWALEKTQAFDAWSIQKGSPDVVIGIVDSGVKWNHEDLAANAWVNEAELPGISINWNTGMITGGDGIDNDGNGFVDDVMGWSFASPIIGGVGSNNPFQSLNGHWHGTHVAGTAAAVGDNGLGVIGLAFNSKFLATKHSPYNQWTNSVTDGYAGIYYMVNSGVRIINCSWGGGGSSSEANLAGNYARDHGSLIIAAAGNNDSSSMFYPAAGEHILSVASTASNDIKSSFSNFGTWIDISAPGSDIFSTYYTRPAGEDTYEQAGGTSMAAPHVAGLAALILSQNPALTVDELKEIILEGADNIDHLNPAYIGLLGAGRINAYNSVLLARPYDYDLGAMSLTGPASASQHSNTAFIVRVRNNGLNPAIGFTINLMAENISTPLATLSGLSIDNATVENFTIYWEPDLVGFYRLFAEIEWDLDEIAHNNQTRLFDFSILPIGMSEILVGNPDSNTNRNDSFVNYFFRNSITQTIYFEEELVHGTIYQMSVRFSGHGDIPGGSVVSIYMAMTDKTSFTNNTDWVLYDNFTEVFTGQLSVGASGVYTVDIILQNPYHYTEGNLAVLVYKDHNAWYNQNNAFQFTSIPGSHRTIQWRSDPVNPNTDPFPNANGRLEGVTNANFLILQHDILNPPTNLSAILFEDGVLLEWQEPTDFNNELMGYMVYRNHEFLIETEALFYHDKSVDKDMQYTYSVKALYIAGESNEVETSIIVPLLNPPLNLTANTGEYLKVELFWDMPEKPVYGDLMGYVLFRDNEPITSVLPTETQEYVDLEIQNLVNYEYYVISIWGGVIEGESEPSNKVNVTLASCFEDPLLPLTTELLGNFPNPFNPETRIRFTLSIDSIVVIEIFNIKGQRIKTLVQEHFDKGSHQIVWDGKDDNGRDLGSGLYFYRMVAEDYSDTKRMILLK